MKYLLDTHVFLWATGQSKKLPAKVAAAITDTNNDVFVGSVTFWEIAIKVRIGKLDIGGNKPSDLPARALDMGFSLLGLSPKETSTMGQLAENTHFDPFDRMLIWQAISRKMILVSGDPEFSRFVPDGLKLLWK
ncbi:type II toxin-antitoxin system VapC family toxin [soil metagenome]